MLKLRESFSLKVHLHIRQDMLQRLWDKYVPTSSKEYGQIELIYLKDVLGNMGKQPEQIQLLLHLILKNKMMQLNLMQYPAPVKICQRQMESGLRRMERYYAVQLKCLDLTMYRTVRQYFTLLEQAQENDRRYQRWQKNYQEIEKQKEEYRLVSLFSEKLRDYLAEYSVNTLRTMEQEFVNSLSDTEYRTLAEELIWQERPEILTYFNGWDEAQCENVVRELEKDINMKQVVSLISDQPVKEKLIETVKGLEQSEFCLFYHKILEQEDVDPQVVIWKENKTEMLYEIDRLKSETLQQMWKQIEDLTHPLEQNTLWIREKGGHDQSVLQIQEKGGHDQRALQIQEQDIQDPEALRTLEKELLYSYLETEYQTLAERLIWQEKSELITYFKECEKDQCKEIVKKLEKDTYMRQVLSSIQKQSAKKKLVAAAYKLEQKEFSLFYWQIVDQKDINPQMVIWKKDKTEMLRSIDELELESLQKVWVQMKTVDPVEGSRHVFTEKMLHLQNQYQQNQSRNIQEQIAVILKENALENIANIVNIEQLMQDVSTEEYTEKSEGEIKAPEFEFGKSEQLVLRNGAYQVIRNLEREQEIRRERIEQQQTQAVETFKEAYHQILRTESIPDGMQKDTAQSAAQFALQIFRKQYQEQLTREEIQNICEWSQALLEVYFAEQEQVEGKKEIISSFSFNQEEQQELTYVVKQINHYIEEQHRLEESLILHQQEEFPKDERIKKLLIYIRDLEEEQRDQFIYYLADMVQLSVQLSSQRKVSTVIQPDGMESAGLPIQSNKQETVKKLLRIEDKELAEKLLQIEDREFAERLLQIGDRELIERLLWIEDREFAEKLLRIEDKELVEKLLRIEDSELAGKLLQNNDKQLRDVSYRNLWEWGEVLLFHPEHQQEWEDADILADPQQEVFSFNEAKQEDAQTQVIRRQIEIAKDRNRLQSLIRQINHQTDIQLVYTDIQLRLPQVQTLLHYVQQLDEKQYGVLVKELVQITKIQKLLYEEPEAAAVRTEEENDLSGTEETNAIIVHNNTNSAEQPIQGNGYESARKLLRIEDKKFIEKLLQVEDREFAKRLLQVEDKEFVERLLQVEDEEIAEKLLQVEDEEFAKRLLQIEDREFVEKLLQIENKEFVKTLLQVEDKEFVEKLLQNNDRQLQDVSYRNLWEWGEALLQHLSFDEVLPEDEQTQITRQQIEIEKDRNHLQSLIGQINHRADVQLEYTDAQLRMSQIQALLHYIRQLDVKQYGAFVKELAQVTMIQKLSYSESGEAVHTGEVNAILGTSAVSLEQRIISYPILEQYIQDYEKQRQSEFYRDIRKIEQKIFPQAYAKRSRQYVTGSSDVGNYVQGIAAYGVIPYERNRKASELMSYEESKNEDERALYGSSDSEYSIMPYEGKGSAYELISYDTGIDEYSLALYEETEKKYAQITAYERNRRENRYQPQELEYSVQKASVSEEDQQRKELRMQQENAQIKSAQEQMDKKLKEVEHQLRKVEDSTKAKENVGTFAEQVKRQLYEELHVEKLRRGLI